MKVWFSLPVLWFLSCANGDEECGGTFQNRNGIIQSPSFPKKFKVPIRCRWVINATDYHEDDAAVIVYFTQLFVSRGLKFTEFETYDGESPQGRSILEVTEQNVTLVQWLLTRKNYLVIDFVLEQLEGNHLRAMDNLLDVYGFNLTYEISAKPRLTACSVTACSFSGHCYASHDFQDYWCSCFPGFSESDCGHGPLCESRKYSCENNGVCRHAGGKLALCSCPDGFIGPRCEVSLPDCNNETGCTDQCLENDLSEPCSCGSRTELVPNLEDHVRYETTVQLTDVNAVNNCLNNSLHCQWIPQLEQQITEVLYGNEISMVDDLRVTNITSSSVISFTFVGGKYDSSNIEEVFKRSVHKGSLGGFGVNSSYILFTQEPALYLKSVDINQVGYVMDEGTEFILSCIAQGSPHMVFRWFKDGVFVNVSKAQRNMWTKLLPLDSADQYTALLGIDHAQVLDQGRYTCQVTDHGYQQCRTVVVEVIEAPQLRVYPMSLTVHKDANISIQCMSPDDLSYSYMWTKNNKRIKPVKQEYWEKLFPVGSMLTVKGIQKSTVFTCHLGALSKSVRVEVTNHSATPWCLAEEDNNVRWEATAPGIAAVMDCPAHYSGVTSRLCILDSNGQAKWMSSEYSECISDSLAAVKKRFHKVTFGYGSASVAETMTDLLTSLGRHFVLYPGEGESYVRFLEDIVIYLEENKAWFDVLDTTTIFFRIIDILLQRQNAIVHLEKSKELLNLANRWGLMWGNQANKNTSHLLFDTMVIDLFMYNISSLQDGIEVALPHPSFSYPYWYSSQIKLHLVANQDEINETASLVAIVYKDLSQLNLQDSFKIVENSTGVSYGMASNVISIVTTNGINVRTEIKYEWVKEKDKDLKCGVSMDSGNTWNLTLCQTSQLFHNVTLCTCPAMGYYTVFVIKIKDTVKFGRPSYEKYTSIILLGAFCGMGQSFLVLMLLICHWVHVPRCYIIFLKMQCCFVVTIAMFLFIKCMAVTTDEVVYFFHSPCLLAFILTAVAIQLCKLLLVYIDFMCARSSKYLKPIVIGIVTGLPGFILFCVDFEQNDDHIEFKAFPPNTAAFYTFLFFVAMFDSMFVLIYLKVFKYLNLFRPPKGFQARDPVKIRLGMLTRSAKLLFAINIMIAFCHLYQIWPNYFSQILLCISSVRIGWLLTMYYVVNSEIDLQVRSFEPVRRDNADLGYNSESENSPDFSGCYNGDSPSNTRRRADIRMNTLQPGVQGSPSGGSVESLGGVLMLANGDSNDSGVQLELVDSRSLEPLPGCIPMIPKPVRSVTFHNDLVTGCHEVKAYDETSPKIKKMDSEVQIVPVNGTPILYPRNRQPEKRTVCVLIDRPQTDILSTGREFKTETSLVH